MARAGQAFKSGSPSFHDGMRAGRRGILDSSQCRACSSACPRETIFSWYRTADNALGIYVSIPFCRSKCTYCNFASGVYPASEHARYVERVIEDLAGAKAWAAALGAELPRRVDTVYLGGGTPSLLAPELLRKAVRRDARGVLS